MPVVLAGENISPRPPMNRAERRAAERAERLNLRPRIVSVEDGARYANVSRAYFYEFFMPRVRTVRMGKRRGIELDSLDEAIDALADAEPAAAANPR
jgi:hypothetical protein